MPYKACAQLRVVVTNCNLLQCIAFHRNILDNNGKYVCRVVITSKLE